MLCAPKVDIIVNAKIDSLLKQMGLEQHSKTGDKRNVVKAVSALTSLITTPEVGFQLAQKWFRKAIPTVTLIMPPSFQVLGKDAVIEFSVNSESHLHNRALITECKQVEPRAKELMLLVNSWARRRGMCVGCRGDFTTFVWTLLTVYFLQVGVPGGALLPPLHFFKCISGEEHVKGSGKISESGNFNGWKSPTEGPAATVSVGELFEVFLVFYMKDVDWRRDVISVLSGVRTAGAGNLFQNTVINADNGSDDGPYIEDPFHPTQNLISVNSSRLSCLHEELRRSVHILQNGGVLAEILSPSSHGHSLSFLDAE